MQWDELDERRWYSWVLNVFYWVKDLIVPVRKKEVKEQEWDEYMYIADPKIAKFYNITWGKIIERNKRTCTVDYGNGHIGIYSLKNRPEWIIRNLVKGDKLNAMG